MADFTTLLGRRIKELREKAGLTQDKAAEAPGITGKYWGEVERGSTAVSTVVLKRMAEGLGVPVVSLLENEHHHPRSEILRQLYTCLERTDDKTLRLYLRILLALNR